MLRSGASDQTCSIEKGFEFFVQQLFVSSRVVVGPEILKAEAESDHNEGDYEAIPEKRLYNSRPASGTERRNDPRPDKQPIDAKHQKQRKSDQDQWIFEIGDEVFEAFHFFVPSPLYRRVGVTLTDVHGNIFRDHAGTL